MEALIKAVDPLEAVEDDVSDALLQLVEEFVDDVIEQTARVAKHRLSSHLNFICLLDKPAILTLDERRAKNFVFIR